MDLYETLGLSKDASPEEIKSAYRKRASETHPDKVGGDGSEFKELALAYQVLGNQERRGRYDKGESWEDILKTDPDTQALKILADMFFGILNQIDERLDIFKLMERNLQQGLQSSYRAIKEQESKIKKFERVRKKIKNKNNNDNLFVTMLNSQIEHLERAILKFKNSTQVLVRALEILDEYEYETALGITDARLKLLPTLGKP